MPLFTYICCQGHTHDDFAASGQDLSICPDCDQQASRLFKTVQVSTMKPYFTRAGDGQLRQIRSSGQERALEAAHGIAHLTDGDMKQMREGLLGQKDRIRKRQAAKREPMHISYERAKARVDTMGSEFVREQVQKEEREPVEAIDN